MFYDARLAYHLSDTSVNNQWHKGIWITSLAGVASGLALLAVECNKPEPDACRVALQASEIFHKQFNDPRDRDLYMVHAADGHPEFVSYLHSDYIHAARTKLGLFTKARLRHCKTSRAAVGTYVLLTLDSQFEHGAATEKFSFIANPSDGPTEAMLDGYIIKSSSLSTP